MFLVREETKGDLKCTWQGELGEVPMQWVDCEGQWGWEVPVAPLPP